MKAILKYPGGKWRIADWIISHFPKHEVYCEPFFGSGGVFFNKKPSAIETINDLNSDIVNLFKVCREQPQDLAKAITLTPYSRDEYIACYKKSNNPLEQARRTLVRYHQSFGTSKSDGNTWRFTQSPGGSRFTAAWNSLPAIIVDCGKRLKEAQIENISAFDLIQRYNDKDTLIYCDPPYLPDIRCKNQYKCEMTTDGHINLLTTLKQSKSKIILSAYDSGLYNKTLNDWYTAEIETTNQLGSKRTEKIYMNFKPPITSSKQLSLFDCA